MITQRRGGAEKTRARMRPPRGVTELEMVIAKNANSGRGKVEAPEGKGPVQGNMQKTRGGPQGANQGGASRGGSRIEPSHTKRTRRDAATKKGTRG
jgi:hypothetical protein